MRNKIFVKEPLYCLEKGDKIIIGRKENIFKKYGDQGALFIGEVYEKHNNKKVYLDSLSPHSIFICGSRGSGKSYTLGVIVEELALKNKNVGIIVIDPVGVFWSMKYPNNEDYEVNELKKYGLEPKGLKNVKVFVPIGFADKIPSETYNETFSIKVSELSTEDWCLTFGIDRFSPVGLLIDKVVKIAKKEYGNYDLDDMIEILENHPEITDQKRGYKVDTRRAIISRLEAAKSWGIFDSQGNKISDFSKPGIVTIIDTSFLEENVSALVIGIIARKILNARKLITRTMSMSKFLEFDLNIIENDIPPTWLFIDEAHTLIPSNGKTPASDALIEYVKQGRRPGCSLVLATQQPSAIDSRVISQLDILIAHKLTFEEDVKAVFKRIPSILPNEFNDNKFLRKLPIGVSLVGDRADSTSRAFLMKTRPRISQHEGRDVLSNEFKLSKEEIIKMIKDKIKNGENINLIKNYVLEKFGIELTDEDLGIENSENVKNYVIGDVIILEKHDKKEIKIYIIDDEIYGHNEKLNDYKEIPLSFLEDFFEINLKDYDILFEPIEEIKNDFYISLFKKYGKIKNIYKAKIYLNEKDISTF